MENNVGAPDRLVRIGAGLVLLALGVAILAGLVETVSLAGIAAAVVGLVLIATGTMRMCPIYQVLGVDTCSR
ncbi:YgaP family membrane protein [Halobacteriaceae archaeon SHR40]|uniref:YgaP family membrane protein n=1 Tax=Halovenus amylolytica TaxID=2500550 RepID=UPI000FE3B727